MDILILILIGWAAMAVVMAALWMIQRRTHNAGIVDIAWTFGVGVLAIWFAWGAEGGDPARRTLIGVLAGVWSARLGVYLFKRVFSETEDGRYRRLRDRWGDSFQSRMFWFFQIQAAWSVIFAAPMFVAALDPTPGLVWTDYLGIAIWLTAVIGEGVADRQLAAFKKSEGGGKVCRRGLWKYSRHPNYFFEWIHWWAYVAIGVTWTWGWLTLFGPAVMLFFLLKVTGVPITEKRLVESKGDAYREYQREVNAFFPGPPKSDHTPSSEASS